MQSFEDALNRTTNPLEREKMWNAYITQYATLYKSNKEQLNDIVKRAANDLIQSKVNTDSPIFLDIICRYCLSCHEPLIKFQYYLSQGIGVKHAKFYYFLSRLYEVQNNIEKARDCFEHGIKIEASPITLLVEKYKEFQKRHTPFTNSSSAGIKRKAYQLEETADDIRRLKLRKPYKLEICSTNMILHTHGPLKKHENWTHLVDVNSCNGISVEEQLADYYYEHFVQSSLSKKSMLILNESMEIDKSIDAEAIRKTIFDSGSKTVNIFESRERLFSDVYSDIPHANDNKASVDENELKELFL